MPDDPKRGQAPKAAADPNVTIDTNPVASDAMTAPPPVSPLLGERLGERIGPYKLLQEIGEGGMGKVYMAEQVEPVRRRVALKIIKPGMDSAQVIARFEAERQALALMDHVNIAKVFDAGATENGRPYFIMELVNGVPITKYCDDAQLNPRERLELFIPVCQAIQHAHQKGIIHRDIKPSNVLVTLADGKPVAKIIDFGVAKATDQRLTERTMFTQYGSIIGTLEYMSPEQAEMSALGVDTRSDIYSLGVLLYELLTGTTPLERAKLREAGYAEILKRIREEEPPRPSTRLSESREALPSISAHRKTEPARLTRLVKGELDWIVMKALEKDRTRRYETASGFARDIQRHLDGDSVEACPPSRAYRFQKFVRKHRTGLATTAAFVLLLVVASVFSAYQAVLANRSRRVGRGRAPARRPVADHGRGQLPEGARGRRRVLHQGQREQAIERPRLAAAAQRAARIVAEVLPGIPQGPRRRSFGAGRGGRGLVPCWLRHDGRRIGQGGDLVLRASNTDVRSARSRAPDGRALSLQAGDVLERPRKSAGRPRTRGGCSSIPRAIA